VGCSQPVRVQVVDSGPKLVANPEHLELLRQGVEVWNGWRAEKPSLPDLHGANLGEANPSGADLRGADLRDANLSGTDLSGANLRRANLREANLREANLGGADLEGADLSGATLSGANLSKADLSGANLSKAVLVEVDLAGAVLTGCNIYGVSAWDVKLSETTKQHDLVITAPDEPQVTVDNIEVAQFVYLLLHNEKIRDVIDTVGKKGVLLLGRFTECRIAVLDRLREELRQRGYLPIVFNFDKPETKDFTETVRLLAGLSKFVIADITNPKSAPLELQATVPEIMVPFRPIIEEGEKPFAMLQDLWIKHREWMFEPIHYS
jgi:Pentapeptide repeats (8 copies)